MSRISGLLIVTAALLLLSIPVSGCARSPERRATLPPGIQLKTLLVNGVERSYYLHIPGPDRRGARSPLVLVLHGGGKGDGLTAEKYLGFTALADREGFVVAYPNGIEDRWNDGRGVTYRGASDTSVDDVEFISRLIDHLVAENEVDPARVYVTGISNGGMMTLRLGCELSQKLAAIAPIAANMPKNIIGACRPEAPLPVLLMNGTDDPLVPYGGGYVHFFRRTMGEVVSAEETVSFWVRHNACNPVPEVRKLPDADPADGSTVTLTAYTGPDNGCEVLLYTIVGGGHTLPGSATPDRPRLLGKTNEDIDGAAVIGAFFNRHSR